MKVLEPKEPKEAEGPVPGILWIHGGGYITGGNYMVLVSCGKMLAERYGAVVVSPEYRLAGEAPYPAALEDCYAALVWMYAHADELGIDRNRIVVGGESAGGGLTAAVCLYARDKGEVPIAPLGLQHLHLHLPAPRLNPNRPERKLPPLRKHREKRQRDEG